MDGTFSSGITITDLSGARTYTLLDVLDFDIYDVKEEFL